MHKTIEPSILYFGTPVVLVSTLNQDGSLNVAPISSIWWLGWSCMIGLDCTSQTTENLKRTGECVLNMPSADLVDAVDRGARTTGRSSVPLHKKSLGYKYVKDKVGEMGLSTQNSLQVKPARIVECPVQLEAKVSDCRRFGENNARMSIPSFSFELDILKVHVEETILMANSHLDGKPDGDRDRNQYVDPDKWHPLIMSFRKFYTTNDYIHESRLNRGAEEMYAPWKKKGIKRKITELMLSVATRKYR